MGRQAIYGCAQCQRGFWDLVYFYVGRIRTWDVRWSEPDMNVVFKFYFLGAVP